MSTFIQKILTEYLVYASQCSGQWGTVTDRIDKVLFSGTSHSRTAFKCVARSWECEGQMEDTQIKNLGSKLNHSFIR